MQKHPGQKHHEGFDKRLESDIFDKNIKSKILARTQEDLGRLTVDSRNSQLEQRRTAIEEIEAELFRKLETDGYFHGEFRFRIDDHPDRTTWWEIKQNVIDLYTLYKGPEEGARLKKLIDERGNKQYELILQYTRSTEIIQGSDKYYVSDMSIEEIEDTSTEDDDPPEGTNLA